MILLSAVFGLTPVQSVTLQPKPDFSGTWELDKSKGNYVKISGLKPEANLILVISHAEPQIKVTRRLLWNGREDLQEVNYYPDGRGEFSRTFINESEGKSKTKWKGKKLVTEFSVTLKNEKLGDLKYDVIQEWKLSADGKTLTQTQRAFNFSPPPSGLSSPNSLLKTIDPGAGAEEIKRVFNRIS
ncbi:MAG TPA: hypothetical protein VFZ40_13475 [Pyrinomonadaceae bacterium]